MSSKVDEYRGKGLEAEIQTTLACDPDVKRQFEDIARQWFKLAELAARMK